MVVKGAEGEPGEPQICKSDGGGEEAGQGHLVGAQASRRSECCPRSWGVKGGHCSGKPGRGP